MATKQGGSEHLFVRHVLIVLGLAAVFFLVWQLRILLLMLFGAIVIASIFRAVADMICKYTRLPNGVSTALSILLVLGSLGALIALFGSHVAQQVQTLRETLAGGVEDAGATFRRLRSQRAAGPAGGRPSRARAAAACRLRPDLAVDRQRHSRTCWS